MTPSLLLFLPASVAVLAYEGEGEGWTVVANESGEEPYAAIDALTDHRNYELEGGCHKTVHTPAVWRSGSGLTIVFPVLSHPY